MDGTQIPLLCAYADILQIGARNMQNFNLLREIRKTAQACDVEARYRGHRSSGCFRPNTTFSRAAITQIILCERGIRHVRDLHAQYDGYLGHSSDPQAVASAHCGGSIARYGTPRSGTARWRRAPVSRPGADALLMEVHHDPDHALSDGAQSLNPEQYFELMKQLRGLSRPRSDDTI